MKKTFVLLLFVFLCPLILPQYHYLKITFSEDMDTSTTKVKTNYTVFNSEMEEIPVHRVGIPVKDDGSLEINCSVIEIPYISYKTNISIRVNNVTDLAGNVINNNNSVWFYFDGFDPQNEIKPYIIIEERKS